MNKLKKNSSTYNTAMGSEAGVQDLEETPTPEGKCSPRDRMRTASGRLDQTEKKELILEVSNFQLGKN